VGDAGDRGIVVIFAPVPFFAVIGLVIVAAFIAYIFGCGVGYRRGWADMDRIWHGSIAERDARIARLIAQLEEARAMARKPLSPDQLDACKAKDGRVCPRCGNEDDDEIEADSIEFDESDGSIYHDVECKDCSEVWRVFYKIDRVEDLEDA
jgi:hypothetical protein